MTDERIPIFIVRPIERLAATLFTGLMDLIFMSQNYNEANH